MLRAVVCIKYPNMEDRSCSNTIIIIETGDRHTMYLVDTHTHKVLYQSLSNILQVGSMKNKEKMSTKNPKWISHP